MSSRPSPTQIVWRVSGAPAVEGCEDHVGPCFVCVGQMTRGKPVRDWMGSNNTDQNRARCIAATHVCEACCFMHSRIAPVPGRPPKEGKKFGGNARNYSHLWEDSWDAPAFGDDGTRCPNYANASKGQKPLIREFLGREHKGPWFAALADSGQKHVLPFAPVNGPGRAGRVLFDELLIQIPEDQSLLTDAMALLTAGATKEEIESGQFRPMTFERCAELVLAFEKRYSAVRGSGWFTLAIWLAQRDEEQVATRLEAEKEAKAAAKAKAKPARKPKPTKTTKPTKAKRATKEEAPDAERDSERAAEDGDRGGTAGGESGVPPEREPEHHEALGDPADASPERSAHDEQPRGVGQPTVPVDAGSGCGQLSLFGGLGSGPVGTGRKRRR